MAPYPAPSPVFKEEEKLVWIEVADRSKLSAVTYETIKTLPADWAAWVNPGVQLAPHALLMFADHASLKPSWQLIYADDDCIGIEGQRFNHRFKPDFNLDLLRSMSYLGYCLIRRETWLAVNGEIKSNYDLSLRVLDAHGEASIGHISDVLFHIPTGIANDTEGEKQALTHHLRRNGIRAKVMDGYVRGTYRVAYQPTTSPLVSILILNEGMPEQTKDCVQRILKWTSYPAFEIIVVDQASAINDLKKILPLNKKVRLFQGTGGMASMLNSAANAAHGDDLLFLSNRTRPMHKDWLEQMMARVQRKEVGIVGARLIDLVTGGIVHAGIFPGMNPLYPYRKTFHDGDAGYMGRARVDQDLSAVSGACMLVQKTLFEEVGGLEEGTVSDIDLCLKIGALGYKVLFTPHATLSHPEEDPEGFPIYSSIGAVDLNCKKALIKKWLPQLAHDPAYNRNLTLAQSDCRVESDLFVGWDPHFYDRLRILGLSSQPVAHRMMSILQALGTAGMIQYGHLITNSPRLPTVVELARVRPDILLFHNISGPLQIEAMKAYREVSQVKCFILLDAIPPFMKGQNEAHPLLSEALSLSDRLIVPTTSLADFCSGMIPDLRVIPNDLEGTPLNHWMDALTP